MSRRRAFVLWGAVAAYAAILTCLSAQPGAPEIFRVLWDKALHAAAYAALALLVLAALHGGSGPIRLTLALVAAGAATIWGALEEVVQMLVPGREPGLDDIVADAIGVAVALALAYGIQVLLSRFRGKGARQGPPG